MLGVRLGPNDRDRLAPVCSERLKKLMLDKHQVGENMEFPPISGPTDIMMLESFDDWRFAVRGFLDREKTMVRRLSAVEKKAAHTSLLI